MAKRKTLRPQVETKGLSFGVDIPVDLPGCNGGSLTD